MIIVCFHKIIKSKDNKAKDSSDDKNQYFWQWKR